jgi:hypothetical protein
LGGGSSSKHLRGASGLPVIVTPSPQHISISLHSIYNLPGGTMSGVHISRLFSRLAAGISLILIGESKAFGTVFSEFPLLTSFRYLFIHHMKDFLGGSMRALFQFLLSRDLLLHTPFGFSLDVLAMCDHILHPHID